MQQLKPSPLPVPVAGDLLYATAIIPAVYYTKLLAHFDGATGDKPTPAASGQTITYVGTAQVSTVQKKFGTASLLLDGNSDYVSIPDHADWDMGSGDWTFDAWIYPTANQDCAVFSQRTDNDNIIYLMITANVQELYLVIWNGGTYQQIMSASGKAPLNAWTHVAVVRYGANYFVYANGIEVGTAAVTKTWNGFTGALNIGHNNDHAAADAWFGGYIDEPRVVKGVAKYTGAFTPPTSAYLYTPDIASIPSKWARLPIGTNGQTLKVNASLIPAWTT